MEFQGSESKCLYVHLRTSLDLIKNKQYVENALLILSDAQSHITLQSRKSFTFIKQQGLNRDPIHVLRLINIRMTCVFSW